MSPDPDPLFCLVYVSSAVHLFNEKDLKALLWKARANNRRDGITGMLLYKDGNFIQMIEGRQSAVTRLQRRLELDPRHRGMMVLLAEPVAERQFATWSMGFFNIDSLATKELEGYSSFLREPITPLDLRENPSRAVKLLLDFKRAMR